MTLNHHVAQATQDFQIAAKNLSPRDWQEYLARVSDALNTEDEHYVRPDRRVASQEVQHVK